MNTLKTINIVFKNGYVAKHTVMEDDVDDVLRAISQGIVDAVACPEQPILHVGDFGNLVIRYEDVSLAQVDQG